MTIKLDINKVADDIDFPVKKWPGHCYEIACAMVDAGVVVGTAVYGHWTGPVHPKAPVFGGQQRLFFHHGWVLLEDGTVVDPTRWVFENAKPYIFVGKPPEDEDVGVCMHCGHVEDEHLSGFFRPCDICGEHDCPDYEEKKREPWPYDEGGDQLRKALMRPPPKYNPSGKKIKLKLSASAKAHCQLLLKGKGWTIEQVFWLANVPYADFGPFALEVYRAIEECGQGPYIPIDNLRRAEREQGANCG